MKLIKLLIYLLIVVLVGMIVLNREAQTSETPDDLVLSKNYIDASFEPLFVENRVLSTKEDKTPEKGNLSDKSGKEYYRELIEQYEWNTNVAWAVMREESHYNPRAYNPEKHNGCNGSFGLMQIACVHIDRFDELNHYTDLYDPATNIAIAHKIWQENSWKSWGVCYVQNGVRKVRCWL